MDQNAIHTLPHLKAFRTKLRKTMTPAEATLWLALKSSKLKGRKFRRQHSIENFIVDFYCAEEKLIIELDGNLHFNDIGSLEDEVRDERLESLGFKVLRFENKLVFEHLEAVLAQIEQHFSSTE